MLKENRKWGSEIGGVTGACSHCPHWKGDGLWLVGVQMWSLVASPSPAFQFSYTAVFGAYTAFLFIRTGWFSVSHMFHRGGRENRNTVFVPGVITNMFILPWSLRQAEARPLAW